jgi:predicted metal-dependent hydrolase
VFLPEPLADYLIVHELAHLKEFNHGKKFWEVVGQTIPDYREKRRELKNIRI